MTPTLADSPETENLRFTRTPNQLRDLSEQLERSGYQLDRLDQLGQSAADREKLLQGMKEIDPTINGDANEVLEDLSLYQQEIKNKKQWSAWEYTKQVPKKVWGQMKKHPYITAAIILGLAGVAAYATGYVGPNTFNTVRSWVMNKFLGAKVAGAAEAAKEGLAKAGEVAGSTIDNAGSALGNAARSIPLPPEVAVPQVPTTAPALDEALKALDALGKGG